METGQHFTVLFFSVSTCFRKQYVAGRVQKVMNRLQPVLRNTHVQIGQGSHTDRVGRKEEPQDGRTRNRPIELDEAIGESTSPKRQCKPVVSAMKTDLGSAKYCPRTSNICCLCAGRAACRQREQVACITRS